MAEIPRYNRPDVEIPTGLRTYIPQGVIDQAGGLALALRSIGGRVKEYEEIEQKKVEATDMLSAQGVLNGIRLGAESDLDVIRRTPGIKSTDLATMGNEVLEKYLGIAQERLGGLRTRAAQLHGLKLLDEWRAGSLVKLGDESDKMFVSEGRGSAITRLSEMERLETTAGDANELKLRTDEIREFLKSITGNLFSAEEAAKMEKESTERVNEYRLRGFIYQDPVNSLNLLADPNVANSLGAGAADRLVRFAETRAAAMRAEQERNDRRSEAEAKRRSEVRATVLTKDILRGKDITADLIADRDLTDNQIRSLTEFQKAYRSGTLDASDPAEHLRWIVASRTGRDPATGQPVKLGDVLAAQGVTAKDKGLLVEKFMDAKESRDSKAQSLRDKHYGRGEQQIKLLLGSDTGLLGAILGGGRRDIINDLNLYTALAEYDAMVERNPGRDPRDIADEVGLKHARALVTRAALGDAKLFVGLGVKDLDDLLARVNSGQIPREQADAMLRLGEFLKFRQQQQGPRPSDQPEETEDQKQRSNLRALSEWLARFMWGSGERRPSVPPPTTR